MAVNMGTATGTVNLDTSNLTTNVKKASDALGEMQEAANDIGESSTKVESGIDKQAAAFAVAAKAVDEMVEAFKNAISITAELAKEILDVGSEFETSMAKVAATTGMSANDVSNNIQDYVDLANAAKEAGLSTIYSASEAAEALNYLALAGYSVEESIEYLPASLTLAAAGAMDLGKASDMVTDAISALGLELEDTDSFIDRMAKTAQNSNTNIQQLGKAILTVGGTATVLAGGVTELDTALGILANSGIKASQGGTALRQILVNLTKPSKQASEIIEELGLKIYDAEGNMRPLNEIFGDLNEIMKDFSDKERMNVITHLFDARQLRSANALLNASGEAWDELYNKIDNAEGAAERMAETMRSNLNGALNIAKSNLENIAITIYEGVYKNITDLVNEAIPKFQELNEVLASPEVQARLQMMSKEIKDIALKLLDVAIDAAPKIINFLSNIQTHLTSLGIIIGTILAFNIATHITQITAALKGLVLFMSQNPYAIVAAGIAAVAVALVELVDAVEKSHEAMVIAAEAEKDAWADQRSEVESIIEEWDEYKKTAEEVKQNEFDHASSVWALYENYKKLYEAGEDTTLAMEALTDAVPGLNEMLAEGKTSFEDITLAVDDYCDSLIRAAELEAAKDTYVQAVKTRNALEKTVITSKEAMDASRRDYEEAQKALKDFEDSHGSWLLYDFETNAEYEKLKAESEAALNLWSKNTKAWSDAKSVYAEANQAALDSQDQYNQAIREKYKDTNEIYSDETEAARKAAEHQGDVYSEASKEAAEKQQKAIDKQSTEILAKWDQYDKKIKAREMTEAEKWAKVGDWFAANPNWDRDNEDLLNQYDKYRSYIEKGEEEELKAREKAQKEKTQQAEKAAKELEQKRAAAVKRARTKIDNLQEDYDWDTDTYAKALKEHLHLYNKYYSEHIEEREDLQRKITNLERQANKERLEDRKKTEKEIIDEDLHRIEREKKHYEWSEAEYNKALHEHFDTFNDYYDKYAEDRKAIQEKIEDSDWALEKETRQNAQKEAQAYFKTWTDGYDDLVDAAQKAYDKLQSKREEFQNKLIDSVELYGTETKKVWDQATRQYKDEDVLAVSSKQLKEELRSIQEFDRTMERLKSKGISEDLLSTIWGMDSDKAMEYASALNRLSAGELQAYNSTYESIKKKTSEMSDKFYKDELEKFEKDYIDPLNKYVEEHSSELSTHMADIGEDTIQGYIDGLEKKSADVTDAMAGYMDSAIQTAKNALGIASPSKEFREIGENTIQGFIDGLTEKIESVAMFFTSLGQTAGENFVAAFKAVWNEFSNLGMTVPTSMITPTFGTTMATSAGTTVYNTNYGLTKDDVVSAIQEAMPSGDIILTVDGTQFGRVSRDSLNLLAQQQGRLGLMV